MVVILAAAVFFDLNCSVKEWLQIFLTFTFRPLVWLTHAGHGLQISRYHVGGMSARSGLAKKVNSSRVMIGNYERNSNTPSIDIILKIAKVFDVSLDYLAGEGKLPTYDKDVLKGTVNSTLSE